MCRAPERGAQWRRSGGAGPRGAASVLGSWRASTHVLAVLYLLMMLLRLVVLRTLVLGDGDDGDGDDGCDAVRVAGCDGDVDANGDAAGDGDGAVTVHVAVLMMASMPVVAPK